MAKDDYYVIVYQILSYLYRSLKEGTAVEKDYLKADGLLFHINERYWKYIILSMLDQGFIRGITVTRAWEEPIITNLEQAEITPDGIDYLCDNSRIKRAYEFAKDVISIVPITL